MSCAPCRFAFLCLLVALAFSARRVTASCIDYAPLNDGVVATYASADLRYVPGQTLVSGDTVFLGGGGFYVFDISDPHHAVLASTIVSGAVTCRPHAVVGGYLIAEVGTVGTVIYDLASPLAPVPLDTLAIHCSEIVGAGALLYGVDGDSLRIVDAADPEALVEVGAMGLPGSATALAAYGDRLFIVTGSAGSTLRTYDLTDPLSPAPGPVTALTGTCVDLDVAAGRLYAPRSSVDGMDIFAVDGASAPVLLEAWDTDEGYLEVAADGTTVALLSSLQAVAAVDVTDPTSPVVFRRIGAFAEANGLSIAGSTAYLNDRTSLLAVDIADAVPPEPIHVIGFPWLSSASEGNIVVGGDNLGFQVMDVSNPAAPVPLGAPGLYTTLDVAIEGSVVYQVTKSDSQYLHNYLYAWDISAPATPALLGQYTLPGSGTLISCIAVHGSSVFLVDSKYHLHVLDATVPSAMVEVGAIGDQTIVTVVNPVENWPYLYYSTNSRTIVTVDVSDVTAPAIVSTVTASAPDRFGLAFDGGLLFAQGATSVMMYDVSDPSHPVYVRSDYGYPLAALSGIGVRDNIVYTKIDHVGIAIRDYSDPWHPQALGWYDLATNYLDLTVADNAMVCTYIGTTEFGVSVMPLQCSSSTVDVPEAVPDLGLRCVPNPFNPLTEISFRLTSDTKATLDVYDVAGRRVARLFAGAIAAGDHTFTWDGRTRGRAAASGTYLFRLRTATGESVAKGVLLR